MRTIALMITGAIIGWQESPLFAAIGAVLCFQMARSTFNPILTEDETWHTSVHPTQYVASPSPPNHMLSWESDGQPHSLSDQTECSPELDQLANWPHFGEQSQPEFTIIHLDFIDHVGPSINPGTGLPMMGDIDGGFDVGGNSYGMGLNDP